MTLVRKSILMSMKSQDSKALSKDLTGQVRSEPPVKLASLNLGTGVGDINTCGLYCLQSGLLSAQHFWKPGHIRSPLNFFKNSLHLIPIRISKWELDLHSHESQVDLVKIIGFSLCIRKGM